MLDLLVGVGTRCAAKHGVAHYGHVFSIEKAEESGALHFVLCGGKGREIRRCGRLMRQAQVKWGRLR